MDGVTFSNQSIMVPRNITSTTVPSDKFTKDCKTQTSFTFAILINYIEKGDWESVQDCVENNPECARRKISIELEGGSTRAYPLHLGKLRTTLLPQTHIILISSSFIFGLQLFQGTRRYVKTSLFQYY